MVQPLLGGGGGREECSYEPIIIGASCCGVPAKSGEVVKIKKKISQSGICLMT